MFGEFLWSHLSRLDISSDLPCLRVPLNNIPTRVTLKSSDLDFIPSDASSTILFSIEPQVFRLHITENWEYNVSSDVPSDTCVVIYSGSCKIEATPFDTTWVSHEYNVPRLPTHKSGEFKQGDMTVVPWGKFVIQSYSEKCTSIILSIFCMGTLFRLRNIPQQIDSQQVERILHWVEEHPMISAWDRHQFRSLLDTRLKKRSGISEPSELRSKKQKLEQQDIWQAAQILFDLTESSESSQHSDFTSDDTSVASSTSRFASSTSELDFHKYIHIGVNYIPQVNSEVTLTQFMSVLICPICLKQNAYTYSFYIEKVLLKELDERKLKSLRLTHWKHIISCYFHFLDAPFVNQAFCPQFKSLVSTLGHTSSHSALCNSVGLRTALREFEPVFITEMIQHQWRRCVQLYCHKGFHRVLEKNDSLWMKYVSSQGYRRKPLL